MSQSVNGAGVSSLINTTAADGDVLLLVDVSDTTEASTGTTKKITALELSEAMGGYPIGTKVYRALLTQTSTNAPVATVLQNTLGGTLVWGYTSTGIYTATLAGLFLSGKTFSSSGNCAGGVFRGTRSSDNIVQLTTRDYAGNVSDAILTGDTLTIVVFP